MMREGRRAAREMLRPATDTCHVMMMRMTVMMMIPMLMMMMMMMMMMMRMIAMNTAREVNLSEKEKKKQ